MVIISGVSDCVIDTDQTTFCRYPDFLAIRQDFSVFVGVCDVYPGFLGEGIKAETDYQYQ
jgi:hypothetical protein